MTHVHGILAVVALLCANLTHGNPRTDALVEEFDAVVEREGYEAGFKLLRSRSADLDVEPAAAAMIALEDTLRTMAKDIGEIESVKLERKTDGDANLVGYRVGLLFTKKPIYLTLIVYDNSKEVVVRQVHLDDTAEERLRQALNRPDLFDKPEDAEAPEKKEENGYLLDDAKLNDVLVWLAKKAGLQYWHNPELAKPHYNLTGAMNPIQQPMERIEELALAYELTLRTKGNTLYALTKDQDARWIAGKLD